MSLKAVDASYQADMEKASQSLDQAMWKATKAKWQRIWDESGVRWGSESVDSALGVTRGSDHLYENERFGIGKREVDVGDLVSVYEDELPDEANQHLHRVVGVSAPSERGDRSVTIGPPLPRHEWPDAIREATVPSTMLVNDVFGDSSPMVVVMDGDARTVVELRVGLDKGAVPQEALRRVISNSARMGRSDAAEGRRREFEIVKGHGGPGKSTAYWQVSDDLGTVQDVERRTLLHRGPTKLAQAALLVARAAYVEGMTEELAVKARKEADMAGVDEAAAPRI